jgi:PAS domain S-box-containing protein
MARPLTPAALRLAAEAQMAKKRHATRPDAANNEALARLVHELQVHQIELEMQNEALRQTQIELEESRDQYVDLYEFAPIGYVTLSASGLIAKINLTGARLFGLDRQELRQKHFAALVAHADQDRWHQHFMQAVSSGVKNSTELKLQRGNGTVFDAQLDCVRAHLAPDESAPRSSDAGPGLRIALSDTSSRKAVECEQRQSKDVREKQAVRHLTELTQDITTRQQTEQALKTAMAMVNAANDAKSRFLAAASHDLRQPLAALRLYTDLLKEQVAPPQQSLVAGMDDCVEVLSNLLDDLLDLSKLAAGVVTPHMVDFPVAEMLACLESVYTLEAKTKGLRLRIRPSGLTGRSDLVLFKRVVGNLMGNALRYTERGGMLVGCRRRQGKTWIEVWDSGIGIAADQTEVIFEEFKQLGDQARNCGSGLGLAIVAKTAALLGLGISVRSWPGRGSVFAIELPLGQPKAEADAEAEPQPAVGHALNVALVEDNALVREAMVIALQEACHHHVVAAASGRSLLAQLGRWVPDIIVTDYRLADGETGYDVITAVRQATVADLPAIIITGDTSPKLIASMHEQGITVLHKPLDLEQLQGHLDGLTALAS